MRQLIVTSPAFRHNCAIPKKFTCQGDDINPEIQINGIPAGAKSLALVVDDPDAPMGTWDHWLVWNIPVKEKIAENSVPGIEGTNSANERHYHGPCPPSGTHRYFFKVYALDTELGLDQVSRKKDLEKAMQGHVLAQGELIGLYGKE